MSEPTVDVSNQEAQGAQPRPVEPTWTARIMERPLVSLGLAGLVGFVFGGGASSRTGAAVLMLIARVSFRRVATEAIANAMSTYGSAKRNGSG